MTTVHPLSITPDHPKPSSESRLSSKVSKKNRRSITNDEGNEMMRIEMTVKTDHRLDRVYHPPRTLSNDLGQTESVHRTHQTRMDGDEMENLLE